MSSRQYRIILNDRCLRNPRTGVGHYVTELMAALRQNATDIAVTPFYSRCKTLIRRGGGNESGPRTAGRLANRWPGWARHLTQNIYDRLFAAAGSVGRFQLYHEPNHIPMRWNGPTITTIHDVSVLRHPEWHPKDRVQWYERDFMPSLPRSRHFITVSQFTRQEMMDLLHIPPERITAIALGAREGFHPRPREEVCAWLNARRWPEDYVLYVGTIEPRKNFEGVLQAYALLPTSTRVRTALLVAGLQGWADQSVQMQIEKHGLQDQVHFLGYMGDEELSYLYCGARLLLWPTFYEGFGLPPLECMASGTPVVSSNCSSIPEVVGDAGILIDPHDTAKISHAIQQILEDEALAKNLSTRGLERSRIFSWSQCAREHANLYRQYAAY